MEQLWESHGLNSQSTSWQTASLWSHRSHGCQGINIHLTSLPNTPLFFSHSQCLFVSLKHKSLARRFLYAWKPGEGRNHKLLEERSWLQPYYLFTTLCCQLPALARLSRAVRQKYVPEWLCWDRTGLGVKMPAGQFGKGTSIPPKPGHFSLVCYNRDLCSGFLPQSILSTELKSLKTCRWKKRCTFGIDSTALWALVGLPLNSVSGVDIDVRGVKLLANYISHMLRVLMGPQEKYFKNFMDVVRSEDYEAQWFSHESYSHSMMPF